MFVQKHLFYTPSLSLEIGQTISATIGYETYGQLSPSCDNAILICHQFSGTSHAAGQYHEGDTAPGWWDPLIGPGKTFDTNRYFMIAADTLCNVNVRDPLVLTTGPASTDPATGRPFGTSFPQVTIRDNVRLQRQLLQFLSVERLSAVAGPSMGGFQALEWAVTYPHMVRKVIAVASSHSAPSIFALAYCQAGIDAIAADPAFAGGNYYGGEGPVGGLTRAAFIGATLVRSDDYLHGAYGRKTAVASAHPWADTDGRYAFQAELEQLSRQRAQRYDANHYLYTARACILHDIAAGNRSIDVAAQKIKAELLMLPIQSDLLFPPEASRIIVDAVVGQGGQAELVVVDSPNGHQAAITECARFAEPIHQFLSKDEMH